MNKQVEAAQAAIRAMDEADAADPFSQTKFSALAEAGRASIAAIRALPTGASAEPAQALIAKWRTGANNAICDGQDLPFEGEIEAMILRKVADELEAALPTGASAEPAQAVAWWNPAPDASAPSGPTPYTTHTLLSPAPVPVVDVAMVNRLRDSLWESPWGKDRRTTDWPDFSDLRAALTAALGASHDK